MSTTAINDNRPNEIARITAKTTPVADDVFLMEDSADGLVKKSVTFANLILGFLKNVVEDTTPQLGGDLDANGKNITDVHELRIDGLPDTDHTANGPTTNTFNAGATIAIGELCYLGSGGTWLLTDASAESTAGSVMLGICMEAQTAGNAMLVALAGSFARDDTWTWTTGGELYISETAGDLTQTAPTVTDSVTRVVGYAVSADVIYFNPSSDHLTHT